MLLTDKELGLLLWAVEGAREAHDADPEDPEFPAVPDWEDLEYRISEQAADTAETAAEKRSVPRVAASLLGKLRR